MDIAKVRQPHPVSAGVHAFDNRGNDAADFIGGRGDRMGSRGGRRPKTKSSTRRKTPAWKGSLNRPPAGCFESLSGFISSSPNSSRSEDTILFKVLGT
jgi:hypothetical protein